MTLLKKFHQIDHPANEDDAKTVYSRSHFAQAELHKLMLSLSTGALAIYFLALTGDRVVVDGCQRLPALVALFSMGIAFFLGLAGWFSEGRRQFYWAASKSTKDEKRRTTYLAQRDRAYRLTMVAMVLMNVFFLMGIASSVGYIAMRILQWNCGAA